MRLLGLREIFITELEIVRIGKGKGKRRENKIIRGWAMGWYSDKKKKLPWASAHHGPLIVLSLKAASRLLISRAAPPWAMTTWRVIPASICSR